MVWDIYIRMIMRKNHQTRGVGQAKKFFMHPNGVFGYGVRMAMRLDSTVIAAGSTL